MVKPPMISWRPPQCRVACCNHRDLRRYPNFRDIEFCQMMNGNRPRGPLRHVAGGGGRAREGAPRAEGKGSRARGPDNIVALLATAEHRNCSGVKHGSRLRFNHYCASKTAQPRKAGSGWVTTNVGIAAR